MWLKFDGADIILDLLSVCLLKVYKLYQLYEFSSSQLKQQVTQSQFKPRLHSAFRRNNYKAVQHANEILTRTSKYSDMKWYAFTTKNNNSKTKIGTK